MRVRKVLLFIAATIITSQLVGQSLNESFSNAFPPELWKVYNCDNGQFAWTKSYIRYFTCPSCARVRFEGRNITNDDWLVTRKVFPTPQDHLLRFFYRSHNPRSESLEIYVSTTGQKPEDFQYRLTAFRFNNSSYRDETVSLAQFDSIPIYIAFRYPKRFGRAVYLDDITGPSYIPNDVGVKSITAPPHYLPTGSNVYPQVLVKNYGTLLQTEFPVTVLIIDSASGLTTYTSQQTIDTLLAQDSILVTFPLVWQATEGIYQVKAFTGLLGDMDLTNDTATQRTEVVVLPINDVAVTEISAPRGTLPPGTITPQALVANYGTNTATFSVVFNIVQQNNVVYTDTISITVEPNASALVNFSVWNATSGIYQSIVCAIMEGDIDTTNNTLTDIFEIVDYYRDVGTTQILAPHGELLENSLVTPEACVANFGDLTETFWVKFRIGATYEDSINLELEAGEQRTVTFAEWQASEIGTFGTKCSTNLIGDEDPLNDFITDSVIVVPVTGNSRQSQDEKKTQLEVIPNPFRKRVTFLLPKEIAQTEYFLTIYNEAGGCIKRIVNSNIWDGTDAIGNQVPKGIYFLKLNSAGYKQVKKVIYR